MIDFLFILLLYASGTCFIVAENSSRIQKKGQELILCRKCGADVADSYYLFSKESPGAHKIEYQNLFGRKNVTVQTLVNPFGVPFKIVTAEKARCARMGKSQGADSWFPGYMWRVCICPQCAVHLGWTFETLKLKENDGDNKSFHGLILGNLLGENFTNSLITFPKMYKM
ncbi:protein cereblon-like [Pararge aegeria]|uniref:Protein cereblon n=1 Tax=Pararge aegeria TaxID=116150 RepID=S4NNC4_9NEOP|nr:protein cereblon-like [Pararge aegeria]